MGAYSARPRSVCGYTVHVSYPCGIHVSEEFSGSSARGLAAPYIAHCCSLPWVDTVRVVRADGDQPCEEERYERLAPGVPLVPALLINSMTKSDG